LSVDLIQAWDAWVYSPKYSDSYGCKYTEPFDSGFRRNGGRAVLTGRHAAVVIEKLNVDGV